MTLELSLLPRDLVRRRTPVPRPARLAAVAALAALAMLVLWYYALLLVDYLGARAELAVLRAEAEQLAGLRRLEAEVLQAERRLQEQQPLVAPYVGDVSLRPALDALARSVPAGVVLERLEISAEREVLIAGRSPTLTDVARLMVALEASRHYGPLRAAFPEPFAAGAAPEATGVARAVLSLQPGVRFELRGRLSGGEP